LSAPEDIDPAEAPPPQAPASDGVDGTVFRIILAIGFCHMLNDMMQSLLPAIYPNLKISLGLSFGEIGLVTLAYQLTASILQPVVGFVADRRPTPLALPGGTLFSLAGLAVLSTAHSYGLVLFGAALLGLGSSVFHPESSRVARMASGGRPGLAQSMFQVGGSIGGALGPLLAAFVVTRSQRTGVAYFSALALLASAILYFVANWYRSHGAARAAHHARTRPGHTLTPARVRWALAILVALIFSKFVYLASLTSYYTFYLIHHFGLSVQDAQLHLFLFLASVAVGTIMGGPLGDRFGRKYLIWFSILGALPFTLAMPHANLFWTGILSVGAGLVLSSAFPAMVVFGQELLPGRVGMISGLFFGLSFGMGGIGAAALGALADREGIEFVYRVCAFLPALGLLAAFLPDLSHFAERTTETTP
jgi:FSR family fosmidomycin resistance protein-like MFS transporter